MSSTRARKSAQRDGKPSGRRPNPPPSRASGASMPQSAAAAVAVHADRRLRVPVRLPHRRAGRAGRHDRLAVRPALRLAERVRVAARPRRRRVPARAVRDQRPERPALRARDEHAASRVEDAVRVGDRARRADDGSASRRGHDHPAHPAAGRRGRRSRARADGHVHRAAASRSSWSASRRSTTAASRPSGRWRRIAISADATGAGQTMRLQTDMLLGIEANHVRARHVLEDGE